jgi:hypothetical protein
LCGHRRDPARHELRDHANRRNGAEGGTDDDHEDRGCNHLGRGCGREVDQDEKEFERQEPDDHEAHQDRRPPLALPEIKAAAAVLLSKPGIALANYESGRRLIFFSGGVQPDQSKTPRLSF